VLVSAFTESSFTCYKLLSCIQEPFLFVNRHAVILSHSTRQPAALSSRIATGQLVS
jgi:hypothetical protein